MTLAFAIAYIAAAIPVALIGDSVCAALARKESV